MHEHVAGAVQRRHLVVGEVGVEVHERAGLRQRAHRAAIGAAVDAVGAEVLDHQLHVVAAGEGLLPGGEQDVDALAADRAADEEEAQRGRGVELVGRALGREALEVDPVGHHVDAIGVQAGAQVHLAHVAAGHPDLVDVVRAAARTHSAGIAPNSHGWMRARRPERGGRRSGGHWWRTSTSAGCGSGVVERARRRATPGAGSRSQARA